MSCLAVSVQIRAKDRPRSVAACIAYLQNSLFHPHFPTFWCAKRLFSAENVSRPDHCEMTGHRWMGFDRDFRVCYQSELIMGSVSEQEYRLQNYNTGDEVSPSGVFLYNPRTNTVLLLKNQQQQGKIFLFTTLGLSLSLVCYLVISFLLLVTVIFCLSIYRSRSLSFSVSAVLWRRCTLSSSDWSIRWWRTPLNCAATHWPSYTLSWIAACTWRDMGFFYSLKVGMFRNCIAYGGLIYMKTLE